MPTAEIKTEYGRSTRRKALLVVNPLAGNLRATETIAPLIEALSDRGYETLAFTTTCRGDATRIAHEYAAGRELLVAVGGDGTVNEIVRGLMTIPKEERPTVGYIPMGSTNDFASGLGLPKRTDLLIENALSGVPTDVDVGSFNGRHYAYLASFGAFTEVSYSTPQQAKNAFGFLAYIGTTMTAIANIKPTRTTAYINDKSITGDYAFVSVSNTPSVAGIINYSKKRVDLNDGIFEVMLVDYPYNSGDFGKLIRAFSSGDLNCELLHVYSCSEARFVTEDPVDWMLDGEKVESGREVVVKNIRSGIRLMLPKQE